MAKIEIYARLRPTQNRFAGLKSSSSHVFVQIGKLREDSIEDRFTKSPGARHDFKFCRTFEEDATQEEVFDSVARKIVDQFVEGYNGTVFAYGQTSTGKTYTVEGSARQYKERGLIPRTLSYLYDILEKKKQLSESQSSLSEDDTDTKSHTDSHMTPSDSHMTPSDSHMTPSPDPLGGRVSENSMDSQLKRESGRVSGEVKVHISYMEIYQDTGYDLLNPGARPGSLMLTLPKVQISERADGTVVVRDLSLHEAATEQVALSLLFQGSTCRKVAETALNQSSSRSHSIFTITMTTKQPGSEVILRSKLHLVDLAGSERVSKTGSDGRILQEAKHINLSLHHLEHVIVSLQQQARSGRSIEAGRRGHIPYRNSMLTMVLKDSLGGNCLTAMIATVSAEEANICETVSTLRFSQRVACISNTASRNEELDDKAVIKKLKRRVAELEKELTTLRVTRSLPPQMLSDTADVAAGPAGMTDTERGLCHQVLYDFFHGRIKNPIEAGINTPARFQESLHVLRSIVIQAVRGHSTDSTASPNVEHSQNTDSPRTDVFGLSSTTIADCDQSTPATHPPSGRSGSVGGSSRKRSKKRRHSRERQSGLQSCDATRPPSSGSPRQRLCFVETPPQVMTTRNDCFTSATPKNGSNSHPASSHTHSYTFTPSHPHSSHNTTPPPPNSQFHTPTPTPSLPHTATPLPTSRLSSGFGSLHDEEKFEFLPQKGSQSTKQNADKVMSNACEYHQPRAQHSPSYHETGNHNSLKCGVEVKHSSTDEDLINVERAPPVSWAKRVVHYHIASKDSSTESTQDNSLYTPGGAGGPIESTLTQNSSPYSRHSKPSPTKTSSPVTRARQCGGTSRHTHTTPSVEVAQQKTISPSKPSVISPAYSTVQQEGTHRLTHGKLQQKLTSPTSVMVVSPEDRAIRRLQEGTERLHRSREKKDRLSGDIQLLSLRVEEEDLKTQLQATAEQLASQHARILHYQQQQQQQKSSSDAPDMCMEKIVEQQLRIKQARLHQKFLNIQQQIKSLETPPQSTEGNPLPISPPTTSPKAATTPVRSPRSPPRASIARMVNEVARTEASHSKVQGEIEQLRVSQAEKLLQLKEAATRRKLQELKQQLLHSNTALVSPGFSDEQHSPVATIPHSQSVIQPYAHSTIPGNDRVHYTPPSTAPQLQTHTREYSTSLRQGTTDNESQYLSLDTSARQEISNQGELSSSKFPPSYHTGISKPTEKQIDLAVDVRRKRELDNTVHITSMRDEPSDKKTTVLSTQATIPSNCRVSPHQNKPLPLKENLQRNTRCESRERQYMSAVQQQRDRVSRIRRCITAATVIQRAWRMHTQRPQCGAQQLINTL